MYTTVIAMRLIAYVGSIVNTLAVSVGYTCILAVSRVQLIGAYGSILFNTYIEPSPYFNDIKSILGIGAGHNLKITDDVEFIKGRVVVYATTMAQLRADLDDGVIPIDPDEYTFIIYSQHNDTFEYINKKIFHSMTDLIGPALAQDVPEISESTVRFISCTVDDVPFSYKAGNYNFYVSGNVFNRAFMEYFIHHYGETGPVAGGHSGLSDKTIDILDQDVSFLSIGPTTNIVIKKSSYETSVS